MGQKRRNGRTTTEPSIENEIAHLRGLDLNGLRARWQSVLQRPAPDHLSRYLLFAILAYRIQADRFGDLHHEASQLLSLREDMEGNLWCVAPDMDHNILSLRGVRVDSHLSRPHDGPNQGAENIVLHPFFRDRLERIGGVI